MEVGKLGLNRNSLVIAGFLIIAFVIIVAPVSAATVTINNGTATALSDAISSATLGETIILNPGMYFEQGITVPTDITIEANTTYGGSPANTIIDAQSMNNIFNVSGSNSLTLDNLTLQNGQTGSKGGAIYFNGSGTLTITTSTFTGCTALQKGGAIYFNGSGTLTITSSTFTGCRSEKGGAIYSNSANFELHFSRIYQDGSDEVDGSGTANVDENWWGTNDGISVSEFTGFTVSSWLVLGTTASPSSINPSQTATVRANLTYNSSGLDTSAIGLVPNGIPVLFTLGSGTGSILPLAGNITTGTNMTVFTPLNTGTATINTVVDGQQVSTIITIVPAPTITIVPTPPPIHPRGPDASPATANPSSLYAPPQSPTNTISVNGGGGKTGGAIQVEITVVFLPRNRMVSNLS